jgi:hypothetical protein
VKDNSITKEFPVKQMNSNLNDKGSVKSPTSATDTANMGGMPEKMTVEQIFAENTPPSTPAESSVMGIAPKAAQGTGK